jgi:signal transduction histidine kinase
VSIVLGHVFEVDSLTPDSCTADNDTLNHADLLILSGDFALSTALATAAARLPVLRLGNTGQAPNLYGRATATMPLSFRPEQLRRQVETLLAAPVPALPQLRSSFLDYPVIPRDVSDLARHAASTNVPILISGEVGTGKSRLARAIHATHATSRFLAISASRLSAAALQEAAAPTTGPVTLYVADVAKLGLEAQHLLLDLCENSGFQSPAGWHEARLICATRSALSDLAYDEGFESDLFYRLSVLPLTLPPMRARADDIRDLVAALARDLGEGLPQQPFSFTPAAIERMERYMWFGNLAELEAVVLRSMAMAPGSSVDAGDLLFDATRMGRPSAPPATAANGPVVRSSARPAKREPASPAAGNIRSDSVELVIQELAHEFRNPMVTIKTLTQRLERLLEDKASRDQVTRMTGEAVDRMDKVLENLLQFTRFGEPVAEVVPLSPLVTNCLSQLSSAFTERQVLLNYHPPDTDLVSVDSAQVGYALENLLRVVLRDLRDGDTLSIQPLNSHGISLEFPARGQLVAAKLAELGDSPQGDAGALSIGFFFAKALVERNGGRIEIHPKTGRTVIAVALPGRGDVAAANGQTQSIGRR